MDKETPQRMTVWWILISFVIWDLVFFGYLSSKFMLTTADSASYYNHTRFLIENLFHGVYPLWDPYWYHGVSNDFFLRRIGAFNPFYLLILPLRAIGIPFTFAYLMFLALYYWSGMIAFYLLAMRLHKDRFLCYGGYLLLMFSALGTRLFDSYLMLITVPLIWFFYFLVAFSQTPKKHYFLGTILSLMILVGTYVPLYFLIIFGIFLFVFSIIYIDKISGILRSYFEFFKKNKIIVLLALLVLALSILPILIFFHDSAIGKVVLPNRHGNAGEGHTLIVPREYSNWGGVEALMYSSFFSDLRQYKFEVIYVPFFSIIVLALGLIGRINLRVVFMFLLGVALFCLIVPHGFPFYDFLYLHTPFLKFFRNLHFFLWFFLIPLFVLLVLEHWRMFTEIKPTKVLHQRLLLLFVLTVHFMALIFVIYQKDLLISTYIMILLSYIFWSMMVLGKLKESMMGFALLTLIVTIQPLEAYHYFNLKALPYTKPYEYEFSYSSIKLRSKPVINPEDISNMKNALYYVSGGYNFLYQNVNTVVLLNYFQYKFFLVDHLKPIEPKQFNASELEHDLLTNSNTAIVFNTPGENIKLKSNDPNPPNKALPIDDDYKDLKVLSFNANDVRLSLNQKYERFLIYTDNFDANWHVFVNTQPSRLYQVNGSVKGVWIPAGHSVVEFRYGSWWQYAMNISLSIFSLILLLGIIWYSFRCKI